MGWKDSGALFQFLFWNLVQGGQEHGCKVDGEWKGGVESGDATMALKPPSLPMQAFPPPVCFQFAQTEGKGLGFGLPPLYTVSNQNLEVGKG